VNTSLKKIKLAKILNESCVPKKTYIVILKKGLTTFKTFARKKKKPLKNIRMKKKPYCKKKL